MTTPLQRFANAYAIGLELLDLRSVEGELRYAESFDLKRLLSVWRDAKSDDDALKLINVLNHVGAAPFFGARDRDAMSRTTAALESTKAEDALVLAGLLRCADNAGPKALEDFVKRLEADGPTDAILRQARLWPAAALTVFMREDREADYEVFYRRDGVPVGFKPVTFDENAWLNQAEAFARLVVDRHLECRELVRAAAANFFAFINESKLTDRALKNLAQLATVAKDRAVDLARARLELEILDYQGSSVVASVKREAAFAEVRKRFYALTIEDFDGLVHHIVPYVLELLGFSGDNSNTLYYEEKHPISRALFALQDAVTRINLMQHERETTPENELDSAWDANEATNRAAIKAFMDVQKIYCGKKAERKPSPGELLILAGIGARISMFVEADPRLTKVLFEVLDELDRMMPTNSWPKLMRFDALVGTKDYRRALSYYLSHCAGTLSEGGTPTSGYFAELAMAMVDTLNEVEAMGILHSRAIEMPLVELTLYDEPDSFSLVEILYYLVRPEMMFHPCLLDTARWLGELDDFEPDERDMRWYYAAVLYTLRYLTDLDLFEIISDEALAAIEDFRHEYEPDEVEAFEAFIYAARMHGEKQRQNYKAIRRRDLLAQSMRRKEKGASAKARVRKSSHSREDDLPEWANSFFKPAQPVAFQAPVAVDPESHTDGDAFAGLATANAKGAPEAQGTGDLKNELKDAADDAPTDEEAELAGEPLETVDGDTDRSDADAVPDDNEVFEEAFEPSDEAFDVFGQYKRRRSS